MRSSPKPGIRVGQNRPQLDPKGMLTVEAVDNASKKLHDPALASGAEAPSQSSPRPRSSDACRPGQLDAGFFYAVEAKTAKLATVSLTPVYKVADYTVTILNRAPEPKRGGGARALPAQHRAHVSH